MTVHHPSWLPAAFRVRYEKLLRNSPRALEILCAVGLIGVALEFLAEIVFGEWFYFRYHHDYAYTLASRVHGWVNGLINALLALWMIGMAWTLLRGASRRPDRGLFSPGALMIWGVLFALVPVAVLAFAPGAIVHFHQLFWCIVAAAACFALAARRLRPPSTEPGPPPPIE